MWFDSFSDLGRVALIAVTSYAALVLILRVAGKRTLAKLNAFDLVVTVALGSTLATILLNSAVSWSEGAVALLMLSGLQVLVAALAARLPALRSLITAEPSVVLLNGELLRSTMVAQRVAEAEVYQAIRQSGSGGLDQVAAVVLETDGTMSVIRTSSLGDGIALGGVRGVDGSQ